MTWCCLFFSHFFFTRRMKTNEKLTENHYISFSFDGMKLVVVFIWIDILPLSYFDVHHFSSVFFCFFTRLNLHYLFLVFLVGVSPIPSERFLTNLLPLTHRFLRRFKHISLFGYCLLLRSSSIVACFKAFLMCLGFAISISIFSYYAGFFLSFACILHTICDIWDHTIVFIFFLVVIFTIIIISLEIPTLCCCGRLKSTLSIWINLESKSQSCCITFHVLFHLLTNNAGCHYGIQLHGDIIILHSCRRAAIKGTSSAIFSENYNISDCYLLLFSLIICYPSPWIP